jgi:hypothetical protein
MSRYLLARAASYSLLIDTALIEGVRTAAESDEAQVDLSLALGGSAASLVIACGTSSRVRHLGVDQTLGLVTLEEADFLPLPAMINEAVGEDIDRVTKRPLDGAHAFRLRLVSDRVVA